MSQLDRLHARGFDRSTISGKVGMQSFHVACSQCEALVISGIACHEHGCNHATHECHGCNVQIPARQRYCADCAG
jgi:hypothetical protein